MYHNPPVRAVSMSHVIQCTVMTVSPMYQGCSTMYHEPLGGDPVSTRVIQCITTYQDCITMYHETLGGDPVSNRVIQCITTYHDCITGDTCITDRDTS